MIKLGVLDFDTSHVVEFSSRINHIDQPEDQWVDGAKVVVACTGDSKVSPERIPMFTEKLKKYGIPIVEKPEDMIGKVDAMLIESERRNSLRTRRFGNSTRNGRTRR